MKPQNCGLSQSQCLYLSQEKVIGNFDKVVKLLEVSCLKGDSFGWLVRQEGSNLTVNVQQSYLDVGQE